MTLLDNTVIDQVNQLLWEAIKQQISDIHIEPYRNFYRIRFRKDGMLCEWKQLPFHEASTLIARLKVLSQCDVAEKRLPQDGHLVSTLPANQQLYDFRLSTCPTIYGEKVVVRLLNPTPYLNSVVQLGLNPSQEEIFLKILKQPQGLILFVGPTGSGKTVSLYAAVQVLNQDFRNIVTIEDPVEIHMTGINQVNINMKAGLTFTAGLKAFLRQNPDVIVLGEIRDEETAQILVKASQTGHLVLSTLHAQDTIQAMNRLISLRLSKAQLNHNLLLLVAQRLIRTLCQYCKKSRQLAKDAEFYANTHEIFEANGCHHCHDGYRGRVGIFELLPMTQEVLKNLQKKNNHYYLRQLLQKKYLTLRAVAVQKVLEGTTSLEEIDRVIPEGLDDLLE